MKEKNYEEDEMLNERPQHAKQEFEEYQEEVEDIQPEIEPKSSKKKMSKKKKTIIIVSIIMGVVLIASAILGYFLILKKDDVKKEENKKVTWQDILKNEAKDGTLKTKLEDKIDDLSFKTNEAGLMVLDIDNDEDYELVALIEDNTTSEYKLMVYEIDEEVKFADDYDLENEKALAYAYNRINENLYYYVYANSKYTVISLQDKSYNEEEFNMNYYTATYEYQDEEILAQTIDVKLTEKDLSSTIEKVIKNKFTNEELLDDNNLSKTKIEKLLEEEKEEEEKKILEEQEQKEKEEEEKKKAEEEAKKKAEEEKQKQEEEKQEEENSLKIGNYTLDYKTYTYVEGDQSIFFNISANSCYYNQADGKTGSCTYKVTTNGLEASFEDKTILRFEVIGNNTLSDGLHVLK